ncbi:MAG: NAD(P)(+) transhydrogenase (Re/Si-specific) subunit beta [Bdellovibrionales bacterium]|nr:NAD(P)(+) transhydrogenase (Re/Si-specific) subunit beta [Bdellovibrionales bacterium]
MAPVKTRGEGASGAATAAGGLIGSVTFFGSYVAFGKLAEFLAVSKRLARWQVLVKFGMSGLVGVGALGFAVGGDFVAAAAGLLIAGLLLKPMGIEHEKAVEAVGLACLLHDIGLRGTSTLDEDEESMTEEDRKIFRAHPEEGARILREAGGIPPLAITAVEQHHERRTGKGFPRGLGAGAIQKTSELVGIAEEFSHMLDRLVKDPEYDLLHDLQHRVFHGFSSDVVEAFCRGVIPTRQR